VRNFPTPTNLRQLRQFLGLTSHYRRFVLGYAKIAHSLYSLTKKGVVFQWTANCEVAFESKQRAWEQYFSQYQDDKKLHSVAYASQSVATAESNYATTTLETLIVVWVVAHFRYYLFRHNVVVITDHAAVKAILSTPNLTGQHASW